MSNYGDTPDETPQDPYGQPPQTPPPAAPSYGQPADGTSGQAPYGQGPASPPPYGQGPAGQPPYGQAPYGQQPYGQPGGVATFSVTDAFGYGWKMFVANLGPIIVATLAMIAAIIFINILQFILAGDSSIVALIFSIVGFLVQIVAQAAIVKGSLDITKGKPITVGSLVEGIDWAQVIIASLIIAVGMAVGIVLLVLPGLAVFFLTSFTTYFIIDKKMGAIDALKASVSFVIANIGSLILLFLASIAAYIVGAVLCGVGLLVAIPVVVIATAYAYRTLNGEQVAV